MAATAYSRIASQHCSIGVYQELICLFGNGIQLPSRVELDASQEVSASLRRRGAGPHELCAANQTAFEGAADVLVVAEQPALPQRGGEDFIGFGLDIRFGDLLVA